MICNKQYRSYYHIRSFRNNGNSTTVFHLHTFNNTHTCAKRGSQRKRRKKGAEERGTQSYSSSNVDVNKQVLMTVAQMMSYHSCTRFDLIAN